MSGEVLWAPDEARIAEANVTRFCREIERTHDVELADSSALHAWSVANREAFWRALWSFADVRGEPGERVLVDDAMPGARWFPDARLNFAANLLRRDDDGVGIVFRGEDGATRELTHAELARQVACLAAFLRAEGVGIGDRVAGLLPNVPEAIVAMLATAALGATWSSCSPDFGIDGVHDRFGQIAPKVVIAANGYRYAGRVHDVSDTVEALVDRLAGSAGSIEPSGSPASSGSSGSRGEETVDAAGGAGDDAYAGPVRLVVVPFAGESRPGGRAAEIAIAFEDALAEGLRSAPAGADAPALDPVMLPFDHPLYILYSSGTTGRPKCIVHGAGGTLLQHLKEHLLHADVRPDERLFFFTTCGWMMWNWLVSGLGAGATLALYDGSPFHPDGNTLFDYADVAGFHHFGTSAKFIDACAKSGVAPARTHTLANLRSVLSTGSPLVPESFDYVYENVKRDVCLSSMSGGTDIVSCFVLGDPTRPVHRGELQRLGFGMDVQVFDDAGQPLPEGEKGELVCVSSFPSMPTGFLDDPDDARYRAAYFGRFPGLWCHGDFVSRTPSGGLVIHGRSDAILNPGGVRIGTAEIYRPVETFDEVIESIVIGQRVDGDVRVVLFVRLREGLVLDDELIARIRARVRERATPRHVPARVVQVTDIPRTRSGKLVELAVARVVHGEPVDNREALANPEALELFRDRPELRDS